MGGVKAEARPLRIAAVVKQTPVAEAMQLGADGRVVRDGSDLEMSAFCRRAVSKAVELAQAAAGSSVTLVTLGPPAAEAVLREGIAWGRDRDVDTQGILLTDPAFAGSDTFATARALAAALEREGPFDLILAGKNSIDADTGQVPPQLAELLDLPFASGVKQLALEGSLLLLGCEHDDSWVDMTMSLPALLSCAERLCDPAKVAVDGQKEVPAELVTTVHASDLGPGPWGAAGSLTIVGECRATSVDRLRIVQPDASLEKQVRDAVRLLFDRGALAAETSLQAPALPITGGPGPVVAVVAESNQDVMTRELCTLSAQLSSELNGSTAVLAPHHLLASDAGSWGVDHLVRVQGAATAEDMARAVSSWATTASPWAILAGSSAYGREVASRTAAALKAGLTGDAIELDVAEGRLVSWKPAFGGQLVAAITATSPVQMATIRAGVITASMPRDAIAERSTVTVIPRGRMHLRGQRREDTLTGLVEAEVVIGLGQGVGPNEVDQLAKLQGILGAEIGCTRKLTDAGRMPHARQVGITGRSISPSLYVAIGTSGKFNHMVGVRTAGTVLAINPDPNAPVFEHADVGIVATFQECIPLLVDELGTARIMKSEYASAVEGIPGTT